MSYSDAGPILQLVLIGRPPSLALADHAKSPHTSTNAPWRFLSRLALKVEAIVPSATHTLGPVTYHNVFTFEDVVKIVLKIQKHALRKQSYTMDIRVAQSLVQSMIAQGWLLPVAESAAQVLRGEPSGTLWSKPPTWMLPPSGIITEATPCYSSTCGRNRQGQAMCYSFSCRVRSIGTWEDYTSCSLSNTYVRQLDDIVQLWTQETVYAQNLRAIGALFSLAQSYRKTCHPSLVTVIGIIQELQSLSSRLLEVLENVTHKHIHLACDVLLEYATYFRGVCPVYISCLHEAVDQICPKNGDLRQVNTLLRHHTIPGSDLLPLQQLLYVPFMRLRTYVAALVAILKHPEVLESEDVQVHVSSLVTTIVALHTTEKKAIIEFIRSPGSRGTMSWDELAAPDTEATLGHSEARRQALIFELITTEADYLHDLQLIEAVVFQPLRDADPFVHREDTTRLLDAIFRNVRDLLAHHRQFLGNLLAVQREEYPFVRSVGREFLDAAVAWYNAYEEYVDKYYNALSRLLDEEEESQVFRQLLGAMKSHPKALGRDIYAFLYLPINRLAKYESIASGMLQVTPRGHHEYECMARLSEVLRGSNSYFPPFAGTPSAHDGEALQNDYTTGNNNVPAVPPPNYDTPYLEEPHNLEGTQDQINNRGLTRMQTYVSRRTATTYYTANESLGASLQGGLQHRRSIHTFTTYWSIDDPALRRINNESDFRTLFHEIDVTDNLEITSVTPVSFGGHADVMQGRLEMQSSQFQMVAVKIIRPSSSHAERVRKLACEIGIWHTLTHPNILPLLGLSWSSSGLPGMVSPWCRNGNAFDYLSARQKQDDFREICMGVLRDALEGLAHLHGVAVIHGDIKGANILISDNGRARLSDFGVSAVLFEHPSRTATGNGTFRWMAPDLFHEHARLTRETDIWAMGCVILELVSLRQPYYNIQEEHRVIIAIHSRQIPPRPPGVPEELWTICLHCFDPVPSMRPLAEMLRLLLQHSPGDVMDPEPPSAHLNTTARIATTSATQPELPAQENLVLVQIYEPTTKKLAYIPVDASIDYEELLVRVSEQLGRPVRTLMYSKSGTYVQRDMKTLVASRVGSWLKSGNRMLWVR